MISCLCQAAGWKALAAVTGHISRRAQNNVMNWPNEMTSSRVGYRPLSAGLFFAVERTESVFCPHAVPSLYSLPLARSM